MGGIGDIFGAIPHIMKAADVVQKVYGPIHRRTTAEVNSKTGFLIWDYMLANEITFQDKDGEMKPFFFSEPYRKFLSPFLLRNSPRALAKFPKALAVSKRFL